MSADLQSTAGDAQGVTSVADAVQQFESKDSEHFHVEYTGKGDDIVYHFWPLADSETFCEDFSSALEGGFQSVLQDDAEVHAEYTDLDEARLRLKEGVGLVPQRDFDKEFVVARETYYVKVVDGLKNPLAAPFLKDRVFLAIEKHLKEIHNVNC